MHGILFIQDLAVMLVVAGAVGWLFQKLGLPSIVGFLGAGILLGPGMPALSLVKDAGRVETLAQLGLVFLMFSIGLRLSVRKLRRFGFPIVAAVVLGALAMYYLSRLLAAALGWGSTEGLFLAGMLMISSSTVVSKVLQGTGLNHERAGQLAAAFSILEDVVAVVMLALLESVVQLGSSDASHASNVWETLLHLGAFMAVVSIVGMILVPRLLKRVSITMNEDLQTICLAALLFGLAMLAQKASYSLALGSFLLGIIVAETPHVHQVDRVFHGMRDVFSAVFFVAIGMQINAAAFVGCAGLIVGVSVFTIIARMLAVSVSLCAIGVPARDGIRAGLMATPIGEFSFVIALLGVGAAVVPSDFFPLAVGVSLLTSLAMPFLARGSNRIANSIITGQPGWINDWLAHYQDWFERFMRQSRRNPLWSLSRRRFAQIGVEMLFVSGVLVFSRELYATIEGWLGHDWMFPYGSQVVFWTLLAFAVVAPLVAIWRNCSALALLFAQVSTARHPKGQQLAPIIETGIKAVVASVLTVWMIAVVPAEDTARWLLLASGIVAVLCVILLRRRLIYLHCVLEVELKAMMQTSDTQLSSTSAPWLGRHPDWDLHMIDCTLPDLADCQGKTIAETNLRAKFGCSIVGIERQGFMIPLPKPDAVLYPRDRVLLMGTNSQVEAGKAFLCAVTNELDGDSLFEEVRMDAIKIPAWSRVHGTALGGISPAASHGVQVAGIHRGEKRILTPGAGEVLQSGDEILVLGTAQQIREFRGWLTENPSVSE
ncbi:MAG TPA: cation:proton antiporter [Opitutaceae bacterium]|nr:cation:proton antiporter [Opitutaceae bacterium]